MQVHECLLFPQCRMMAPWESVLCFQTLLVCMLSLTAWAEVRVTKCFKGTDKEPQGEATLSCPVGSVISINDALIGKNQWYECVLTEEDCMHSTGIFRTCEGLNTCTKSFRTLSARCGYITILLISYECIQVAIPTTPIRVTTTSPIFAGGRGPFSVESDEDSSPTGDNNDRNRNPYSKKTDSEEEDDPEIGLLIATIGASLVTGVMLIIAIIMTIRRILNYPTWLQRQNRDDSTRWDTCMERACFQVDKFPCFSGSESPEGTPQQALRSQSKSAREPMTADEQVPNLQRTRMTPIGQEASDSDIATQPQNIVNRNDDPEGSNASDHAQTSDSIDDDVSRSPFKHKRRNDSFYPNQKRCDSNIYLKEQDKNGNGKTRDGESVTQTLNNNVVEYSCLNNKCKIIPVDFNELDPSQILCTIDFEKECNININCGSDFCKDFHKEMVSDTCVDGMNVDKCGNNNNGQMECTTIKAKYSAIVVPNTETSSRC